MDVSIVIPTKNAGPLFEKVLDMIFSQKTIYEYEVICVDSGSKDQTLEVIKKYPCKLYQIPASEFGHGKQELMLYLLHRMHFLQQRDGFRILLMP